MPVEKVYIFRIAAKPGIKLINATKVLYQSTGRFVVFVHNNMYFVKKDGIGNYIEMGGENWYINDEERQKEMQDEPLFVFLVNPQTLKVDMAKVINKIFTRGGIEFQHWGSDTHTIGFNGLTGSILPDSDEVASGIDLYNTPAYRRLQQLRDVYTYDQDDIADEHGSRLLGLHYRRKMYVGHFERFSFEESEDRPFQFAFDAQFVAHFEATDIQAAVATLSASITARQKSLSTLREILGTSVVNVI